MLSLHLVLTAPYVVYHFQLNLVKIKDLQKFVTQKQSFVIIYFTVL